MYFLLKLEFRISIPICLTDFHLLIVIKPFKAYFVVAIETSGAQFGL